MYNEVRQYSYSYKGANTYIASCLFIGITWISIYLESKKQKFEPAEEGVLQT